MTEIRENSPVLVQYFANILAVSLWGIAYFLDEKKGVLRLPTNLTENPTNLTENSDIKGDSNYT